MRRLARRVTTIALQANSMATSSNKVTNGKDSVFCHIAQMFLFFFWKRFCQ